ncbi:hypothetical protein PCAR4_390005 [Paraburkholderia caribensis]|nr:hypothetical protein PCAR4_390005 [Paraburkholderia caribensis]
MCRSEMSERVCGRIPSFSAGHPPGSDDRGSKAWSEPLDGSHEHGDRRHTWMPDFSALRESHACESVPILATGQQTLRATIATG